VLIRKEEPTARRLAFHYAGHGTFKKIISAFQSVVSAFLEWMSDPKFFITLYTKLKKEMHGI